MKQNKAYKFRLYPNSQQSTFIDKTIGCSRFIYNKMLSDKIEFYKLNKKMLYNTPAQYKQEFEWLKEVDSRALANAQINLQTAYSNFFRSPKIGFPKFKSKRKSRLSYTTNNQRDYIRIINNMIKLPKIGFIKIKQDREIPNDHTIKSCTVSKTSSGKYLISILVEYDKEITTINKPQNKVGLDFAMNGLYVDSNNNSADYPNFYRKSQKKLSRQQRKMSKKEKGSNNRSKQRVRLAKVHEKISNQRKDFLHKQSTTIAKLYDVVCIEDLNMKAMSKALKLGKSVHDNGWGMFTSFLNYKLKQQGKHLVKVDKWFPSTKLCSNCGCIQDILLSQRTYSCRCGLELERDYNSAINILNEGLRVLGFQ